MQTLAVVALVALVVIVVLALFVAMQEAAKAGVSCGTGYHAAVRYDWLYKFDHPGNPYEGYCEKDR